MAVLPMHDEILGTSARLGAYHELFALQGEEDKRQTDDREFATLRDMLMDWHLFFSPDFDATQVIYNPSPPRS